MSRLHSVHRDEVAAGNFLVMTSIPSKEGVRNEQLKKTQFRMCQLYRKCHKTSSLAVLSETIFLLPHS